MLILYLFLFFFQAEDGIRDGHVTGVQTCALPISAPRGPAMTISAGFSSLRAKYPYRAVLCATDVSVCRWNFPAANVTGNRSPDRLTSTVVSKARSYSK